MSPKKNNRPFTHNHEKSGLTKLPKRPMIEIKKTPEEICQEIEGLRMHMADQEECKSDNIPTEKPFSSIPVSDKIIKEAWDDAEEALLSQMQRLKPISEAYLVSKKLDKVLNEIKTERQFEQIYNESKANHFYEKNLWINEKELLQSRINELEAFSYSQAQEKQNLINNLESEKQQLKHEYLELHAENVTLEGVLDENLLLEKELETLKESRNQDLFLFLNQEEKIKTLEKKIAAKNDFIKDLQDQKFEVEVDLEESKESYDNLNKKHEELKIGFTELQNYSSEQSDKIYELDRDLKFQKYNYDMTSKLLKEIAAENTELREERKNLKSVLDVKTSSLNEKNAYIEYLENIIMDYLFKNDNWFLSIFNASKSNGTFYFSIWLVIWVVCLFTVFNFIG